MLPVRQASDWNCCRIRLSPTMMMRFFAVHCANFSESQGRRSQSKGTNTWHQADRCQIPLDCALPVACQGLASHNVSGATLEHASHLFCIKRMNAGVTEQKRHACQHEGRQALNTRVQESMPCCKPKRSAPELLLHPACSPSPFPRLDKPRHHTSLCSLCLHAAPVADMPMSCCHTSKLSYDRAETLNCQEAAKAHPEALQGGYLPNRLGIACPTIAACVPCQQKREPDHR